MACRANQSSANKPAGQNNTLPVESSKRFLLTTKLLYILSFNKTLILLHQCDRDCQEQQALKHRLIKMISDSSLDEVEGKPQRNLDVATTASLDLVALNNKVNIGDMRCKHGDCSRCLSETCQVWKFGLTPLKIWTDRLSPNFQQRRVSLRLPVAGAWVLVSNLSIIHAWRLKHLWIYLNNEVHVEHSDQLWKMLNHRPQNFYE